MHIHIVSPERNWIFARIAKEMQAAGASDPDVNITIGDSVDPNAAATLYLNWFAWRMLGQPRTGCDVLYFTHVNRGELLMCVGLVNAADHTTCMSEWERQRLIDGGAQPEKMTTILPGMDADTWPTRPIRLGLSCRYYADGRREDEMLLEVARRGALAGYELHIIGTGWEPLIAQWMRYGVVVRYYHGTGDFAEDYRINHSIVPQLDLLWNVGRDTTLGVLDALASGVPILSQPTSFAVDFAAIDGAAHWYHDVDELETVLRALWARRVAIGSIARSRTWDVYGREMLALLKRVAQDDD